MSGAIYVVNQNLLQKFMAYSNTVSASDEPISSVISQLNRDKEKAYNKLFPLIYNDLKDIAAMQLAAENSSVPYTSTDLVHEIYMKWYDQDEIPCNDKAHLVRLAAKTMRQILIDHARKRLADKRGGNIVKIELNEDRHRIREAEEFLELDEACKKLRSIDERLYNVIELKYFCGLSIAQVAEALDISVSTVDRDWKKARKWLYSFLNSSES